MRRRKELERIFALMANARLMGLPLMPPFCDLRLLPYLTPSLLYWHRMKAFYYELEGADLKHLGHWPWSVTMSMPDRAALTEHLELAPAMFRNVINRMPTLKWSQP
jgi:hypothetical protein